jgi:YHS domain-containing protein
MMVGDQWFADHEGKTYYFMNPTHREMFLKNPSKFLNR